MLMGRGAARSWGGPRPRALEHTRSYTTPGRATGFTRGVRMNRKLSTLAFAALLSGAGLTGCGGTGGAESPSSAQVTEAVRNSTKEFQPDARMDDEHERDGAESRFLALVDALRQVPQLAPLFDLYQVPNPVVVGDDEQSAGLIQLLRSVRITMSAG